MGLNKRITSKKVDRIVKEINLETLGAGEIRSDLENETRLRLKDAGEEIEFPLPKKPINEKKSFLKYINKQLKKSKMYAGWATCHCSEDREKEEYKLLGFFYREK